jgi:diguanylate cyclase (GGDEF)-like protein
VAAVAAVADKHSPNDLHTIALNAYRSVLRAIGKSAVRACPTPGTNLEEQLTTLAGDLARNPGRKEIEEVQVQVEDRLDRWGTMTEEHLKGKADEVKELLIMLAKTAQSVGERDQRYTSQFGNLTAELKAIANLDDITTVRSSLVTKVTGYETKLKAIEKLASRDSLTGLGNRRGAEGRMDWCIAQEQTFCVVLVDLDGFKKVNDKYGHEAGDDLLKQFSEELQKNTRSTDMVARWGGDEFIVVLVSDLDHATPQIERIRKWVLGKYTIQPSEGRAPLQVQVEASIGVAEWSHGKTIKQVVGQADAAMYRDKKTARMRRA